MKCELRDRPHRSRPNVPPRHRIYPRLDRLAGTERPWHRGAAGAIARFAAAEGFEIAAEFIEIETGKGSDALDRRPQLAAALADARRLGAPSWSRSSIDSAEMSLSLPA